MYFSASRGLVILTALALVLIGFSGATAKDVNENAGTSAFSFLKINQGARPVAMGGAFTGLADDEAALYYNPAGLVDPDIIKPRFVAGYHNYFLDIQSGMVGYMRPFKEKFAFGVHMSYLSLGEFTETDVVGNELGTFNGSDWVFGVSMAYQQSYQLSFGVTAKFIYESIEEYSATGLALDLGAKYASDRRRWTAGIMLQNIGTQLSALNGGEKDGLPTTLRLGGGAKPRGVPVQFSADIIAPFDNDIDFAIGAEFYELKPFYLRMGWNSFGDNYKSDDSDDSLAGFTFGLGVDYKGLQLSYALTPGADLGESHRITLAGGI